MKDSFIDIKIIAVDNHTISCRVANSYHKPVDKSVENTSGIGLENLRKQLQLLYPNRHELKFDVTKEQYVVELIINLHNEI